MARSGVLLDVDGVLVVSWKPIPGAVEAVRAIREMGLPVVFLTNTTSRTRSQIAAALSDAGFPTTGADLITAGSATAAFLSDRYSGARCLVLNDGPLDDFAGVEVVDAGSSADVVVIGSAGPSFSWALVNEAARAILAGAEVVAMHGTATWKTSAGICVDGGAYVALLERATGCVATTIGKPAPEMFVAGLEQIGARAGDAVMVGDDLQSDVLAAQAIGIRGVLVRTGKFRPETLVGAIDQPDAVIESVADLPGWISSA